MIEISNQYFQRNPTITEERVRYCKHCLIDKRTSLIYEVKHCNPIYRVAHNNFATSSARNDWLY